MNGADMRKKTTTVMALSLAAVSLCSTLVTGIGKNATVATGQSNETAPALDAWVYANDRVPIEPTIYGVKTVMIPSKEWSNRTVRIHFQGVRIAWVRDRYVMWMPNPKQEETLAEVSGIPVKPHENTAALTVNPGTRERGSSHELVMFTVSYR